MKFNRWLKDLVIQKRLMELGMFSAMQDELTANMEKTGLPKLEERVEKIERAMVNLLGGDWDECSNLRLRLRDRLGIGH